MAFLPFERLTIKTHLNPEEARQKLSEVLEERVFVWHYPDNHLPYRGKISGYEFEIFRVIHYTNSFLPRIKGKICSTIDGTVINITMMPHIAIVAFMSMWLGFAAFIFLVTLIAWIFSIGTFYVSPILALLAPAGMFAVGYSISTGAFKFESHKSRQFLRNLFEAHQEKW